MGAGCKATSPPNASSPDQDQGYSSCWGRSSKISYHGALEPTNIWPIGLSAGSSTSVPYGTRTYAPSRAVPSPIDKRPAQCAPHFVILALLAEECQRSRAFRHSELLPLDLAPRQECRASGRTTVRAVADKRHDELVRDLILDGMAGAAPLQHTDSLGLCRTQVRGYTGLG